MNEKRGFEKIPTEEMLSEEDDFLELTDEAAPVANGDSDVIMLNEEVSPGLVVGSSDPDILDLTEDALLPEEETDMDLLELLEEASDTADADDEDILDLSEVVSGADFSETAAEPAEADEGDADMEDILMLLEDESAESDGSVQPEKSTPAPRAKDLLEDGFELGEALDVAITEEAAADTATASAMGTILADELGEDQLAIPPVSNARVEAALERVIERMLGEKIDRLLTAAIEKAVTKEINRLKQLLASNLSDIE